MQTAYKKIEIQIKTTRGMTVPSYATPGSAAVDLRAAIEEGEELVIQPGAKALVPTGLAIAPKTDDVVAIVAARSGLAVKHGVCLSNGIGVIDSDYRGEICVGLYNTSDVPFIIRRGDRIAQLMFVPVMQAAFIQTDELDETERGTGGFGSTGVK
ncbi:MAG: dUTP diphosphatase [Clostridia bacterium]|nr:dUTP diphosphatase [Clostridia bacterium]